jgi:sulfonate transport system substrate-binding protein
MKKLVVFLLMTAVVFSAAASGKSETGGIKNLDGINVSYVKSPFNLPSIVAKKRGMLDKAFEDKGVKVNIFEINSGAKQSEAMAAGSLDIGGVVNTTSVILANANGNNIEIVSGYSRPEKVFALVVMDKNIQSIKDLKGKKIAGPKGTILHQMLASALESEGLEMDDVEFIQMGLPKGAAALQAGYIDGALLAAGLLINSEKQGGHVLFTAEGYVKPILAIAARGGFKAKYPEAVKIYVDVHKEAYNWIKDNYTEAIQMGADEQGISFKDAEKLYSWTSFDFSILESDAASLEKDIEFLKGAGMLEDTVKLSPEDFINID